MDGDEIGVGIFIDDVCHLNRIGDGSATLAVFYIGEELQASTIVACKECSICGIVCKLFVSFADGGVVVWTLRISRLVQ